VKRDARLFVSFGLSVVTFLVACGCSSTSDAQSSLVSDAGPGASATPGGSSATPPDWPAPDAEGDAGAAPTSAPSPTRPPSRASKISAADRAAGIRSRRVENRLSGRLVTVSGSAKAPGEGRVVRIKVQVERGVPVDGAVFAGFVLDTLNDERSWGHGGARTFARTDGGDFDVRVVLASPATSRDMCRPLETLGRLSCRSGDAVVLTYYRWVNGIPDYGKDRTGYRQYLVNHEVGHSLGRGHEACPGPGRRAPVMMQQTKGLLGCEPNPWPFP
jgi:hypothetical protein